MLLEVVQKKFPFVRGPAAAFIRVAIERRRKRGDQIKLSAEIGQRFERADAPGQPVDSEQLDQLVGEWIIADVESDTGMAGLLRQKQKETGPTSEIENLFWFGTVQFQFLNPRQIDRQPVFNVSVLCVARIRPGMASLDLAQLIRVDFRKKLPDLKRVGRIHSDNSPAFQRWDNVEIRTQSRKGRKKISAVLPESNKIDSFFPALKGGAMNAVFRNGGRAITQNGGDHLWPPPSFPP